MPKPYLGRVILIHGANFHKATRGANMKKFAPAFRACGFCVVIPTYGFLPALLIGLIPWLDKRIAETLGSFVEPNDILVGHSNGGTLIYLIAKIKPVRGAVLINAALEVDKIPEASFVHVYYNKGDILTRFSNFFPCSPWGAMGGCGYIGSDPRVTNINCSYPPEMPPVILPILNGHSDIFRVGKCRKWARFMAESVLQAVLALRSTNRKPS